MLAVYSHAMMGFRILNPLMLLSFFMILLTSYCFMLSRSRSAKLMNAIPGPGFIGSLIKLIKRITMSRTEMFQLFFYERPQKYGDITSYYIGTHPVICISSPEFAEPILSSSRMISKTNLYSPIHSFCGRSLGLLAGSEWKLRRRLLTPAFHTQILNSFTDVFNEKSNNCIRLFEQAIETHNDHYETDILPIVSDLALDAILATSMGQTRKEAEKTRFLQNLDRFENLLVDVAFQPWLSVSWISKLSSVGQELKRTCAVLTQFTKKVIQDRRKDLKEEKEKFSKLPNKLLENNTVASNLEDAEPVKKRLTFLDSILKTSETNHGLTDDVVTEEVNLMMIAGHDTTALSLTWFLYLMAKHPEHQELVMEELDQVFADSDRPCTAQDLGELKYLELCIKETLRLYPSLPLIARELTEDVEINGYKLPIGATAALFIGSIHRNPRIYPDPEAFNPERFLPENSVGRHPFAFIPFSAGPRNCIGQKYAMIELKVFLANFLRRFRFSLPKSAKPIEPSYQLLLKPSDKVRLVISKRLIKK